MSRWAAIFLIVLTAAACAGRTTNMSLSQWQPEGETAIVLGSTSWKGLWTVSGVPVRFEVKAGTGNYGFSSNIVRTRSSPKQYFRLGSKRRVVTVPGIYAIDRVETAVPYVFSGFDATFPQGMFSVKPGEIVYIGHIHVEGTDSTPIIRVEDRFEEYLKDLPQELQPYADRIEKRLIKLPGQPRFRRVSG